MSKRSFAVITTILTLSFIAAVLIVFKHVNILRMVNSDILYVDALYMDFFNSPFKIAGWQVVRAPAFLPDWPLYFLARWISGEFIAAHVLYMSAMVLWYMLLFYGFIKFFFGAYLKPRHYYYYVIGFGALLVLPLAFKSHEFNYTDTPLFDPTNHQSPFIWGFPIVMLWLRMLDGTILKMKHFICVAIFALIATASDIWFIIHFVIPLSIAIGVFWIWQKRGGRPELTLLFSLFVGTVIGYLIPFILSYKNIFILPTEPVGLPLISFNSAIEIFQDQIRLIWQSFRKCFQTNVGYGAAVLLAFAYVLPKIWRSFKGKEPKHDKFNAFLGLQLFFVLNTLVVVGLIAINGMWVGIGNLRYMIPMFVLSFFIVSYKIIQIFISKQLLEPSLRWICFSICFCLAMFPLPWPISIPHAPYADMTACMDNLAKQHNLKYGLAEYWQAKYLTSQSRAGIVVNQSTYRFDPLFWINNYRWYLNPETDQLIEYDFFASAKSSESFAKMPTTFGEPSLVVDCIDFHVFIFKDEKRKHFNDVLRPKIQSFIDTVRAGDKRPFWRYVLNLKDPIPVQ